MRRDVAINLRAANELHLTIKCTGNGTFHLQGDQWQRQTPFSERLVSGMIFRRQPNQSPHTNTDINQAKGYKRERKKRKRFQVFLVKCMQGLYLNQASCHLIKSPQYSPYISWIMFLYTFQIQLSYPLFSFPLILSS